MAEVIEISRLALHDQVAARLRTMLIEGHIAPGAKLNERELCEQLRVSRTPLREAIKLLAAEGLVDLLPNRGAVAVKLTEADVINTFELLSMLVPEVLRDAGTCVVREEHGGVEGDAVVGFDPRRQALQGERVEAHVAEPVRGSEASRIEPQ